MFGMQDQGWVPNSILPWQEQADQSSCRWEATGFGTHSQGKQPGVVAHVDGSARLVQLICIAKGSQDSSADNLPSRGKKRGKKELLLAKCTTHHLFSVSGTVAKSKRVFPTSCQCWSLSSPILIAQHIQSCQHSCSLSLLQGTHLPAPEHPQQEELDASKTSCAMKQLNFCAWTVNLRFLEILLLFVTQNTELERDAEFVTAKNRVWRVNSCLAKPNRYYQEVVRSFSTPALFTRPCQKQTGAIPQGNPEPHVAFSQSEKHSELVGFAVS